MDSHFLDTKLSFDGLMKASWRMYKENFSTILPIILTVYIPVNILIELVAPAVSLEDGDWGDFRNLLKLVQLLEAVFGILATMAIAWVVKKALDGETVDYKAALKEAQKRWGAAIMTGLHKSIYLLGLTILLVVPALIYSVYWAFTEMVVILTDKKNKEAMDYSKSLVNGNWGRVTLYGTGGFVASLVVSFLVGSVGDLLPEGIVFGVITDTAIDVADALFTVAIVLFFLNLERIMKLTTVTEVKENE